MVRFADLWRRSWAAVLLFVMASAARGQDPSPATRPLLDELNRETQSLYNQAAPSIVRVQLPGVAYFAAGEDPLAKWASRLDPDARRQLEEIERQQGQLFVREDIAPTTAPSDTTTAPSPHIILMQLGRFVPNAVGVVIDQDHHVVVPRFTQKDDFRAPAQVLLADGKLVWATFVASDRPAELTVLQLQDGQVKPAVVATNIPNPGSLLMVMPLNPAMCRLVVWQGEGPDQAALVNLDGQVAGICQAGRFFSLAVYQPLTRELIEHGQVRRAVLGVVVRPVAQDDPQRKSDSSLGATPALRVLGVIAGSVAEKAGLQPNDLILALADQPVGDVPSFAAGIATRRGKTDILALRNGHRLTITVDLQVP